MAGTGESGAPAGSGGAGGIVAGGVAEGSTVRSGGVNVSLDGSGAGSVGGRCDVRAGFGAAGTLRPAAEARLRVGLRAIHERGAKHFQIGQREVWGFVGMWRSGIRQRACQK